MRAEAGNRRLLRRATFVGLCLATTLAAGGVSGLMTRPSTALSDATLADRPRARGEPRSASLTAPLASASAARRLGEQILARNIFDSHTGALRWLPAPEPPPTPASPPTLEAPSNDPPPRCAGALRLVASMVDAARPQRSLAALRKDEKTHLLAPGSQLDDLTLLSVQPTHAYLQAEGGALCFLSVFREANESAQPERKPPEPHAAGADSARGKHAPYYSQEELERGVRPLGRRGYAVARELLLRALKDPGKAASGALFRPIEREGHALGMEVRAVQDKTLLRALGVQSGDVVRSLNGADLTSASGLLAGLRALREDDEVMLVIQRDNAVHTVQYLLD